MLNWIKKKLLKWAIGYAKGQIKSYVFNPKTPSALELQNFWNNIYGLSCNQFLSYCTNQLSQRNLDAISFPMYLKSLISPLRDDIEGVVAEMIDGMDPKED